MNCPNCQTENSPDARFCFNCGSSLVLACAHCGTELPDGARFCTNCGRPTDAAKAAAPPAPAPTEAPDAEQDSSRLYRYLPQNLLDKLEAARSSGLMEGERRVVTILFCDVKGSTAAAAGLDPEEWSEIMNGAFEPMIAPVYRYEGTVARLTGDGLLAFFGAPIAHEDDPQRAVLAGLAIVEAIEAYAADVKRRWNLDFAVRVGINTGLVVVGAVGSDLRMEYTALGNAINLAARMEQTAGLNTVQIAEPTYRLVAPLFKVEDLGGLQVKGIADPVQAYRALGARQDPGSVRGIAGLHAPLVGREEQMAALRSAASGLADGVGGVISVTGEAGLGKSRLVSELRDQLAGSNILWLEGRSLSFETSTPYAPFKEIFAGFFELQPRQSDAQKVQQIKDGIDLLLPGQGAAAAPFLASLMGIALENNDAERIRFLQPPELRAAIFAQVQNVLAAQLRRQPLLIYVDDLHWADPSSLELLTSLLPLVQNSPLLVVTAFRPRHSDSSWAFHEMAAQNHPSSYRTIALEALDQTQSKTLVSSLLTIDDLPEAVRETIMAKSEGNPFFVEETIRTLLDNELVVRENGRWQATREIKDIAFPDTLIGVITARLDRLDEGTRQIAQAASVLGREFSADVLAGIVESSRYLDQALPILLRREIVQETAKTPQHTFIFKHILTQEAAYNSVLLSNRRELHRRAAQWLQDHRAGQPGEIAHHWLEARRPGKALPLLVEAGEDAARAYATAEAIAYFEQALAIDDATAAVDVQRRAYEGLGDVLAFANRPQEALAVFEKLLAFGEAHGDPASQISALNKMAATNALRMGQFPAADGLLARSAQLIADHEEQGGAAELALIRCQMCTMQADFEGVITHMNSLVDIGEQIGDKGYMAMGLEHVASSKLWLAQYDEAKETAEKALDLSREIGDLEHEAVGLSMTLPMTAVRDGEFELARAFALEGIGIGEHIGDDFPVITGHWILGEIALWQGDFETAVRHLQAALDTALPLQAMMPWFSVMALGSLGTAYLQISKQFKEKVVDLHHEALRLLEAPGGAMTGAAVWSDLGFCAIVLDDYELAGDVFGKGLNVPSMYMLVERPRLLAGQALVLNAEGDREKALASAEEGLAFAEEKKMRHMMPVVYLALGQVYRNLGRTDEALAALQNAFDAADELGMRPDMARALQGMAGILQESGRADEAAARNNQARMVIEEVAAGFEDETLRQAYLESAVQAEI